MEGEPESREGKAAAPRYGTDRSVRLNKFPHERPAYDKTIREQVITWL